MELSTFQPKSAHTENRFVSHQQMVKDNGPYSLIARPSFAGNSVLGPEWLIAAASCYLSTRLVLLPTHSSLELDSNNIFGQFVEPNCRSISDYSIFISRFRPPPKFYPVVNFFIISFPNLHAIDPVRFIRIVFQPYTFKK